MAKTAAPPFRADHVGSLLRPPALKEARQRHADGALDAAGLAAVEDREIERVIKKQQELGLLGITDGELRRSWWHLDFLWGLDGIAEHQADFGIGFVGATPRTAGVRVDGKIGFSGHPMLEHYRFLQQARRRRAEAHDSGAVGAAWEGPCCRRSTSACTRAARICSWIWARPTEQPCAPSRRRAAAICSSTRSSSPCSAMRSIATRWSRAATIPMSCCTATPRLINTAIADIPADMTVTMHLCRGNFKSTYMGAGGYDAVEDVLFNEIDVHGYFMEYDDERSGGFEPLRLLPPGKRVALGLVTTKRGALENKDDLKRRIDAAAKFADARAARARTAVRFLVDGGGQSAFRGRAMGEARAHRRRGARGLGLRRGSARARARSAARAAPCSRARSS